MFLLVVDLLHGLAQVRLQLVVGVVLLGDPLLEGHVGGVPVAPHLVGRLGDQVVHLATKALGGRAGRWMGGEPLPEDLLQTGGQVIRQLTENITNWEFYGQLGIQNHQLGIY